MASAAPPAPSGPSYGTPNARQDLSLVPRKVDAPLGPPELRLFEDEAGQRVEPFAPPPAPASASPLPSRASGPSDFTRMLTPVDAPPAAPPTPTIKPNAKPAAAAAGGGRKPSLLPLILVVTFALVAGAALILYFVLRSPAQPR